MTEYHYPLTPPSPERTTRGLARQVDELKRRACGPWVYPGAETDPTYGYQGTWVDISGRRRTRYRWLLGGGVEIQLKATGGAPGSVVFQLRPGFYDPDEDPDGSGHDLTGAYRAWHINGVTGEVTDGVG